MALSPPGPEQLEAALTGVHGNAGFGKERVLREALFLVDDVLDGHSREADAAVRRSTWVTAVRAISA